MAQRVVNSFDQIVAGEFKRTATDFHNRIQKGGTYPPEANRYHLYVSLACPWAHRCLILRALKGLTKAIGVVVVHPVWGVVDQESGRKSWVFGSKETQEVVDGVSVIDPLYHKKNLREIYELHNPDYVGRYTVPVLFDTKTQSIVNNESSEILQILDREFDEFAEHPEFTIFPSDTSREVITAANDKMYNVWNNGVYRAGFAQSQEAYEQGVKDVFEYLDYAEQLLGTRRFLCGSTFTESDIRFMVTALRFDGVYNVHFKCSLKKITEYPNIYAYMRDVFQNIFNEEARKSFSEMHIKWHYYRSHEKINPFGIVPITAPLKLEDPVDRATRFSKP